MAASDRTFVGYSQRKPGVGPAGGSKFVTVSATSAGYELIFVTGSGDCPAGCIDHTFTKFTVARDGTVEKRCEWAEGEEAGPATPC